MSPVRTVFAALALTALVACDQPSTVGVDVEPQFAKGGVVHSAGGGGHFTYTFFGQPDTRRTFSFNAKERADGTFSGQFNLVIGAPLPGFSENPAITRWSQGEVVCLFVDGNQAWIGGVIRNSSIPGFIGDELGWMVEDNGQGRSSDPDRMSTTSFGQGEGDSCSDQPDRFLRVVERGNIQVR